MGIKATPIYGFLHKGGCPVIYENSPYNWYTGAANSAYYYVVNGGLYGSATGTGGTGVYNGTVGLAIDNIAKKFWLRQSDGTWVNGDPVAGTGGVSFANITGNETRIAVNNGGGGTGTLTITMNVGTDAFIHSVPDGYQAGLFQESEAWRWNRTATPIIKK